MWNYTMRLFNMKPWGWPSVICWVEGAVVQIHWGFGSCLFCKIVIFWYQKDFLLHNSSFVIYAAFQAMRLVLMCHTYWLCEDNCLAFNRLTCCWIFMLLEFCNAMFICWVFFFREVMETSFLEYYDYYKSVCSSKRHLQGQTMQVCS